MDSEVNGKYTHGEPIYVDVGMQGGPLNEQSFRQIYQYQPAARPPLVERIKREVTCSRDTVTSVFPILTWLPGYKREDLLHDVIAGLTVAIMHIPQGMAYALLGGVPPVVGIYMAFFPVLVYILMGTSRHVSMGTFAVVSMMVGRSVGALSHDSNYSDIEIATAVCLVVGLWQIILSIFKLGSLSVLFSDTLVSGFTTGAAVHVLTSQVKNFLGLKLKKFPGPFKVVNTYLEMFTHIQDSNYMAVILSVVFLAALLVFNEVVKPTLQKRFKRTLPIPIELLVIIIGTLLSVGLSLEENYDIAVVASVPTGLPVPKIPPVELLPALSVDGFVIAVVAISINLSMASIFAKKLNYEIDGNQEILASGVGNIVGAFFSCMPFSASLSRSLIQESVGGRTQLASAVSCSLLVVVLLFIGPFFEPLPYCILSTIIVVALKGMFLQFKDLPKIWRLSKLDSVVWLITFWTVVIVDIDYGLGVGLLVSIVTMLIRNQNPEIITLGQVPNTNLYLDLNRYRRTVQPNNTLVLQLVGALHFANGESTRKKIMDLFFTFQESQSLALVTTEKPRKNLSLVLSLSAVPYLDPSAIKCLDAIYKDLKKYRAVMVMCECTPSVYETIDRCNIFKDFPKSFIFPTLHDAVDFLIKFDPHNVSL